VWKKCINQVRLKTPCNYLDDRNLRLFILRAITIFVVGLVAGFAACGKTWAKDTPTEQDGWTMKQTSTLMGDMTVIVSPRGLMATSTKQGLSLLFTSPFKEVVLFSDRTKKYCVEPFDQFRCTAARTMTVLNNGLISDIPVFKKSDRMYAGVSAHIFESTSQYAQRQLARYKAREVPGRAAMFAVCICTDDFKLDPHIGTALVRFYGTPVMPGMPVYIEITDLGNDKIDYLATSHIKKAKISDSTFALPVTYKKVARHEEVYVNQRTSDELELMNLGH
jgi:hypothetical protein